MSDEQSDKPYDWNPPKPVKILVILLAMPFMLPFEIYYRIMYPEFRWSKYPATMRVKVKRYLMRRGEFK